MIFTGTLNFLGAQSNFDTLLVLNQPRFDLFLEISDSSLLRTLRFCIQSPQFLQLLSPSYFL